ncbi:MAG: hypothetical protein HC850_01255 [Rhodomicrobium sp.]|nr:hypothetical protein [Rhodomicrobium sp.]
MSTDITAQRRHEEFVRQQHERSLTQSSNQANAAAAELIAERIAAKLAEQNDIIYRIGQKQGRTSFIAYLSLVIGGLAAIGQLFGPIWEWPVFRGTFG